MNKWMRWIHSAGVIILLLTSIWFVWLSYERTKLNRLYGQQIERQDKQFDELYELRLEQFEIYKELNEVYGKRIEGLADILSTLDRLNPALKNLLNARMN